MIYTVTFSPSLDYTVSVNNFRVGVLNRTTEERIGPGGKGINVSMVLRNFGIDSVALGFVGGFTGDEIVRAVGNFGVRTDMIFCKGLSRINVKVMDIKETEINGQGTVVTEADIIELENKLSRLACGDFLVLAGSVPSSLPPDIYERILKKTASKGINAVVDASGKLLTKVLPYKPFLVKPNNFELGEIFGVEIKTKEDIEVYSRKLQTMGAKNVVISLGGDGAYILAENGKSMFVEAPHGQVVDTVGSGDSLVAGFLAEWLVSKDYFRAFLRGVATGSASAFRFGLATKEESDVLFKRLLGKISENK